MELLYAVNDRNSKSNKSKSVNRSSLSESFQISLTVTKVTEEQNFHSGKIFGVVHAWYEDECDVRYDSSFLVS